MTPNEMLRRVARGESEFDGVHLPCAALAGAALASVLLTGANLRKADLHESDLQAVRLQDADLREANLRGANLALAIMRRADLRNADLRRANLQHRSPPKIVAQFGVCTAPNFTPYSLHVFGLALKRKGRRRTIRPETSHGNLVVHAHYSID